MLIPDHKYTDRELTVCDILRPLEGCRSMLNVGMRFPDDPRNHWWLKICEANGIEPHVLEIFEPNVQSLRAYGIRNVVHGDVRDAQTIYRDPFDITLWWHGPEHLHKAEAERAMTDLSIWTKRALIVGCPFGECPQDAIHGNEHERHLSTWDPTEFSLWSMRTAVVYDEQPAPHITAWRIY